MLYLKGNSTNDFDASLKAIYGEEAGSLSVSRVSLLKEAWYEEYEAWRKRRLSASQYAYICADGVYFDARVEAERNCMLVIIGAKYNGEKELLAIADGVQESEISWKELLLELKNRGMEIDPKLAIAVATRRTPSFHNHPSGRFGSPTPGRTRRSRPTFNRIPG